MLRWRAGDKFERLNTTVPRGRPTLRRVTRNEPKVSMPDQQWLQGPSLESRASASELLLVSKCMCV